MNEEAAALEEEETPEPENREKHTVDGEVVILDDNDYSKSVRTRISREVRKTKEAAAAREAAEVEAKTWRDKAMEMEAKLQEQEHVALDSEITSKQALLKEAIEEGDAETQVTLMAEMAEMAEMKAQKLVVKREEKKEPEPEPPEQEQEEPPKIHPSAMAFIRRHKTWWDKDDEARALVIEIEKDLRKNEGFEVGSDLYKEIDERLAEELPDLETVKEEVEEVEEVSPVRPKARSPASRRPPRESNHMTKGMRESMGRYGLDPKNPEHIKAFLKHRKGNND